MSRETVPEIETVTETVETIVQVPATRTDPLILREYPEGVLYCSDLEDEILYLETVVDRANADRAWIREREGEVIRGSNDG